MSIDMTPTLRAIPFLKDVPRRAARAAAKEARWFSLPAGYTLFETGDEADELYFVLSGTLGVMRKSSEGRNEFVGHIRAGEPAGEMALFLGGIDIDGDGIPDDVPHNASVYAFRDSEIMAISRKGWQRLVKAEPELLEAMMRLVLMRLGRDKKRSARAEPKVFTLLATSPTIDLKLRAKAIQKSLAKMGLSACVIDENEGDEKPAAYFDELENKHDVVMLISPISDDAWYRLAMRQADRIWVMGRADARPSVPMFVDDHSPARTLRLIDVVLLHMDDERKASRPSEWANAARAARVFHWSHLDGDCCDRLARTMAGRSIGLVMSGGGARAYAHIGVVKALREKGVPIDFVGGASMGAVVAGCVAMDWDDAEIDRRIRKAFVDSNPLGDYTLPVVGMVKGKRVNQRLREHFAEAEIGDLDVPFFAVSTNLTDGAMRVHRNGLLRQALRATISLPGILPPVVDDGEVLVDGAVLNNFPVDIMRNLHRGIVIGSDTARAPKGLHADDFTNPPSFFGWVARHGLRAAPPIAGLLMRAATVSVDPQEGRKLTDILILPDMSEIELRDWESYDECISQGYKAAMAALNQPGVLEKVRSGSTPR